MGFDIIRNGLAIIWNVFTIHFNITSGTVSENDPHIIFLNYSERIGKKVGNIHNHHGCSVTITNP